MKIHQIDIVTAFLNGSLEEKVYMEKPERLQELLEEIITRDGKGSPTGIKAELMLKTLQKGDKVCLLNRAIYGLKQAARQWHKHLDETIQRLGLTPTISDPCVYTAEKGKSKILLLVYVDDILIASTDVEWIKRIKTSLGREFETKDLGPARYCLGIEIKQSQNGTSLTQQGYIREILNLFRIDDAYPVATPRVVGSHTTVGPQTMDEQNAKRPYRELVGALMYLAMATRPDIAHTVSHLAQFNDYHTNEHWVAAKRVLRYLKGSSNHGLSFRQCEKGIIGYSDADWGNCPIDRRSYIGYTFILNGASISWKSQKQRTVALSSTEAEYIALAETGKEANIQMMLQELGYDELTKITLYCDNRGALSLTENNMFHSRTKHIDIHSLSHFR